MGLFSELLPFLPASRQHRLRFILEYRFPPEALVSLRQEHPDWSEAKIGDAFRSLRQFLCLPLLSSGKARRPRSRIEMPSFVADEAWHAFLRSPRAYSKFCRTAYGFELSHIPDPSASPRILRAGDRIKPSVAETWRRCEAGSRELPALFGPIGSVPLLFSVDAFWKDGWIWTDGALEDLHSLAERREDSSAASASSGSGGSCGSFSSSSGECSSGNACGGSSCSGGGSSCGGGCGG